MISDSVVALVILGVVFVAGFGVGASFQRLVESKDAAQAIKECEAPLPRNQHCEIVLTARRIEE